MDTERQKTYLCIDLKSFYASVECVDRGLDPFTTNLVVADPERTEKTICLAVSPAMKALGVKKRCRVFEIPKGIQYIMAPPRMQLYIDYSARIYGVYLKYIARDEMFVYSIDEAFLDATYYLDCYHMTAREIAVMIMDDIFKTTGVTASCGIGTNLYLAKIALDITAKHAADHIGYLDEALYQKTLWDHTPITDFWRIGAGTAARLYQYGIATMRGVTEADEALLHRAFGVDAELLIDHAWGREPTTIADVRAYKPQNSSLSSGQVIAAACDYAHGLLLLREMVELMCLELVDKGLVTNTIGLYIGFADREAKGANGSSRLSITTNSHHALADAFDKLYQRIIPRDASIKRISISVGDLADEALEQYDLFTDPEQLARERRMQHAVLDIKKKFGKNAILRGMSLKAGATTMERNMQIGGHKSGVSK